MWRDSLSIRKFPAPLPPFGLSGGTPLREAMNRPSEADSPQGRPSFLARRAASLSGLATAAVQWPSSLLWRAAVGIQAAKTWKERVLPATDSDAAKKSMEDYRARAEALLGETHSAHARNRAITGAYAALFLKNPDAFLWAGMAAYASQQVGFGIDATGGPFGIRATEILPDPIGIGPLFKPFENGLESFGSVFPNPLRDLLIAGNGGVYRDIAPLFLAYLDGGLDAVLALEVDERLKSGFRLIDSGTKLRERGLNAAGDLAVWEGNKLLLRYEQQVTLQGSVYDPARLLWKLVSGAMLMRFETGPVPNPASWTLFQQAVPLGDIGSFHDRWEWISAAMLPLWKSLLEKAPASVRSDMIALRGRGETAKGGPYTL